MNRITIKILFITTLLWYGFSKAQEAGEYLSYYEFGLCDSPQVIILKHHKDDTYSATINTHLKKEGSDLEVVSETTLFPGTAREMILKLKEAGIDSADETYNDESVTYLDGDALTLKLLRNNKIESFVFPELYPSAQQKAETTPLRLKVQNWLGIIDREENLNKHFSDIKKALKRGTYCYSSGINTICFKKK
ncbi:hypothetical protein P2W68_00355 [Chryseobacterium arthrosphaerae]|uniref:hypothetical protein n=1 Tax=Chryseobacterium arthrosphaerae TaxID=651561 RepID=UPI0023E3430F|nr:hypothetical protein [Chryseobacterium arthrosphaerae]WES98083.1 hypothetical protein P2W68_00355 [Chryseobacterium arthrosphaerae]